MLAASEDALQCWSRVCVVSRLVAELRITESRVAPVSGDCKSQRKQSGAGRAETEERQHSMFVPDLHGDALQPAALKAMCLPVAVQAGPRWI